MQRTSALGLPTPSLCVGLGGAGRVGGLRSPVPGMGVVMRSSIPKVRSSHHRGTSDGVRGYTQIR